MLSYKTILVAVDGSECSNRALDLAILLAKQFGSTLVLAHVLDMQSFSTLWPEKPRFGTPKKNAVTGEEELHYSTIGDYRREYSTRVVEGAAAKIPAGIPFRIAYETGSPRRELLKMIRAYKVDMAVVGSRGLGRLAGILLGTVSGYVVKHTDIPEWVVK